MSADDREHMADRPGQRLATTAARVTTEHMARRMLSAAGSALLRAGAAAGGKTAITGALVLLALVIAGVALLAVIAAPGAIFQHTTAAWPVPLDSRPGDGYTASGWIVTSPFGWRSSPLTGNPEFHDGIDIASPDGRCPLGPNCPVASIFDGIVRYVGWDQGTAREPAAAGGGQVVIVSSGDDEIETLYAHLAPYQLHVQLQGRIDDSYGRYDDYSEYREIGHGELSPTADAAAIALWCAGDAPTFQPVRNGATVTFLYDRPASCRASVLWPQRGDGWEGWIADDPPAGADGNATLAWQTPLPPGRDPASAAQRRAGDTALRFRAHLTPPPPPPTATPVISDTLTVPLSGDQEVNRPVIAAGNPACERSAGGVQCTWLLGAIPAISASVTAFAPGTAGRGSAPWHSRAAMTATPTTTPAWLTTSISASRAHVPVGSRLTFYASVSSSSNHNMVVTLDPALLVQSVSPGAGACRVTDNGASCNFSQPGDSIVSIIADVRSGTPMGSILTARVDAIRGDEHRSDTVVILVDQYLVTPQPWPPPTALPTATITWPTPVPAPTAPAAPLPSPAPPPAPPPGSGPGAMPAPCLPLELVPLHGVTNAHGGTAMMRLAAPAAASFTAVRTEILLRTGTDPLARLADALRAPEFRSTKPGVALMSWHMAGRAIDLDTSASWRIMPEGRMYRVWSGTVDVTAIFERHGWNRITAQNGVPEWWHYEYHPDHVSWAGAMVQVWPRTRLQSAFPQISWLRTGCGAELPGSESPAPVEAAVCTPGIPSFATTVEELPGCGPPLRAGDQVFQLDSIVGFVGTTGQTTGAHLHLGIRQRGYNGAYMQINICSEAWLHGMVPPPDASCWTEMADPIAFLPLAPPDSGGPAISEGAPYQLPPPNHPGSLYTRPPPGATPVGQYWSPYQNGGRYGGGRHGGKAKPQQRPTGHGMPVLSIINHNLKGALASCQRSPVSSPHSHHICLQTSGRILRSRQSSTASSKHCSTG